MACGDVGGSQPPYRLDLEIVRPHKLSYRHHEHMGFSASSRTDADYWNRLPSSSRIFELCTWRISLVCRPHLCELQFLPCFRNIVVKRIHRKKYTSRMLCAQPIRDACHRPTECRKTQQLSGRNNNESGSISPRLQTS